jgi:SulP family sulfate permease
MPSLTLPTFSLPPASAFSTAFLLLVIPQLPLTFGNAVVAVSALEHEYFGERAERVTPSTVCISCAAGNIVSALMGGMPMCHGSGGLTAHFRLGARTAGMNLLLGTVFVVLGLFFADQVVTMVGLLPLWALAAFLAYAGLRHALLIFDLHGRQLAAMLVLAMAGVITGNLAVTTLAALAWVHLVERSPEAA